MGLLDRGQAALVRRQKQAAGRTVAYARPGGGSWEFTAWPGTQLFAREATSSNAATVERADADYLFTVADARAAGMLLASDLPPRAGDRITDPTVLDDQTGRPKVFEVRSPTGETPWRYSDQGQTTIRVHCMRVE